MEKKPKPHRWYKISLICELWLPSPCWPSQLAPSIQGEKEEVMQNGLAPSYCPRAYYNNMKLSAEKNEEDDDRHLVSVRNKTHGYKLLKLSHEKQTTVGFKFFTKKNKISSPPLANHKFLYLIFNGLYGYFDWKFNLLFIKSKDSNIPFKVLIYAFFLKILICFIVSPDWCRPRELFL